VALGCGFRCHRHAIEGKPAQHVHARRRAGPRAHAAVEVMMRGPQRKEATAKLPSD
jgi:hypothetical protein